MTENWETSNHNTGKFSTVSPMCQVFNIYVTIKNPPMHLHQKFLTEFILNSCFFWPEVCHKNCINQ